MIEIKLEKTHGDITVDGEPSEVCSEATCAIKRLLEVVSEIIDSPFNETADLVIALIKDTNSTKEPTDKCK